MSVRRSLAPLTAGLATVAVTATAAGAQQLGRARVSGSVTDATTSRPIAGVTVRIVGTSFAAVTDSSGRFTIANAAVGQFNVEARRIGYGVSVQDNVRLVRDSTVTLNFRLVDNPLRLQSVVVSGTVEATQNVKTPFTVATLTAADLPVAPVTSAASVVQGKVAGVQVIRGGGGPGSGVTIQLRTPTSQFKTTSPLYVVDGVVQNTQTGVTTRDIATDDIASVEVIKGAAAASLYGSMGANGVISITTNRGNNLALNTTQFTVRTEAGMNSFTNEFTKPAYHHYRTNAAGGYVNAAGRDTTRRGRVADVVAFKDNPYVDPLFNPAKEFFNAGTFNRVGVTLQQNLPSTNFAISYNRQHDGGVVFESDGFHQQTLRVNVDHRRGDRLQLNVGAFHSRGTVDEPAIAWDSFFSIDPDVNINRKTPDGLYVVLPDSNSTIVNPLYRQQIYQDWLTRRARTQLSTNATLKLTSWLNGNANINYDRSDQSFENYIPRGILGTDGQTPTLGTFERENDIVEGINGTVGLTATHTFGRLTPRLSVQALSRREQNPFTEAIATDFSVAGVRDLDVGQTRTIESSFTDRRLSSVLSSLNLDYADKLIGDFSVQREGNSLYGPESRWNNWYRASGAYRMAEEAWWPLAAVNEFKLRYSYGTAGNRPSFYDQYETLELAAGGLPTRQSFGNAKLRPEVAREHEFGIDAIVKNRVSLSLVYARQVTSDNIISMPLPALSGFNTQEQNVGKVSGHTLEATLQAQLLQRGRFSWDVNLVADRSRTRLREFGRSCYGDGIRWRCDGSNVDEMWGEKFMYSTDDLPAWHASSKDAFQVNDDGVLVAVGRGNSYRDGVTKNLWGTTVVVDGRSYAWGRPILQKDSLGNNLFTRIGRSFPSMNYGFQNTVRFRDLQVYASFHGQVGGNVYNNIKQALYQSTDHNDVVQAGKPEELKKPIQYYTAADGLSSNNANYNSYFVESGTYMKLGELSVRYTIPQRLLGALGRTGVDRASLELVGRDLFTWTNYTGIDPEAGSPAVRVDNANYPMYRVFSAAVNLTF
ncbi:SusC/RagA family TonB-linked outer membrane protein [Roseisolibacter agri]|uniref:SusC/RagA family TonB-linked outer membrane protein n=1 Tax=Roseisolibacter agri TaxID=2014610 RepID=UPI0024E0F6D9|nr:SusC/RagA family TonB-linked outer membrane protein [Roseisolibacter agri]